MDDEDKWTEKAMMVKMNTEKKDDREDGLMERTTEMTGKTYG